MQWREAKYSCLKGLTHQLTGSERWEAHYWQRPILLLIRKYGTLLPSQMICSWHLGGIKKSNILDLLGSIYNASVLHLMRFYHKQTVCTITAMTTTLWSVDFYPISLLENNSTCICYKWHDWGFKYFGSLEVISEGVKRVKDPEVLVAIKSSKAGKTKLNKTRCLSRFFYQFRGELPGYRLNAQRLYNESLKTFPWGCLPSTYSHRNTCTTYARLVMTNRVTFFPSIG